MHGVENRISQWVPIREQKKCRPANTVFFLDEFPDRCIGRFAPRVGIFEVIRVAVFLRPQMWLYVIDIVSAKIAEGAEQRSPVVSGVSREYSRVVAG